MEMNSDFSVQNAAVIAIGTELTTGQIVNGNAQWISAQLYRHGLETLIHLTVPDEEASMLESLELATRKTKLIFVTGGLGPTSDDFTREVVAKFCKRSLIWNETSWEHLCNRLNSRGIAVQEIQRQQCFFPEASTIIKNDMGTANAFYCQTDDTHIFVLPGPPKEISSVWKNFIEEWLYKHTQHLDPKRTYSWDCLGLPESEVAARASRAMAKSADHASALQLAYRVHLPYVELKLSFLKSQQRAADQLAAQFDQEFADIFVLRNGLDLGSVLQNFFSNSKMQIVVFDQVSNGYLLHRLSKSWKNLFAQNRVSLISDLEAYQPQKKNTVLLSLTFNQDEEATAKIQIGLTQQGGYSRSQTFQSPYQSPLLKDRTQLFFTERALHFWHENLHNC